jgi:hypothetical protein
MTGTHGGATRCCWIVLAAALQAVCGCGTEGLKTYPVRGKVVFPTGEPLRRGVVQFQPGAGTSWTVLGETGDDGTFTLATVTENSRKLPGAPAGRYHLLVLVPPSGGRAAELLHVQEEVCTVEPRDNELTVEVARGPAARR